MASQPLRHEFKAVIEGIELPPEVVERVNQAVRQAVMTELADVDLSGMRVLRIPEDVSDEVTGHATEGGCVILPDFGARPEDTIFSPFPDDNPPEPDAGTSPDRPPSP